MFDPKAFLSSAVARMKDTDKQEIVRDMLEQVAQFVDQHDVFVPEIRIKVGIVEISLSAKKIENVDTP